jgi:MFS family permease
MYREFRRYWTAICHLGANMRLLLAGAALLGLGNGIFLTFFNLYLKQGGLGEAFLGRLNSLGTIGSLALAIPAGLLVTRLGSRMSLVLSCALIAVFGALQAGILVPALLIVLQIGVSASNMLYGATYNPEMMRSTDPGDRQIAFSLAFTIGTVTSVVASVVGGLLPRLFARFGASPLTGLRLTLFVGAGFILASTAVFVRVREYQHGSGEQARDASTSVQTELEVTSSWKRFAVRYAVVCVIIGFGAGLSIPYLNLYFADRFHSSTVAVGNLFAMSNVVLTVGVLLAPWLVRRAGLLRTIGVTVGGSLVFLVIMRVHPQYHHRRPGILDARRSHDVFDTGHGQVLPGAGATGQALSGAQHLPDGMDRILGRFNSAGRLAHPEDRLRSADDADGRGVWHLPRRLHPVLPSPSRDAVPERGLPACDSRTD